MGPWCGTAVRIMTALVLIVGTVACDRLGRPDADLPPAASRSTEGETAPAAPTVEPTPTATVEPLSFVLHVTDDDGQHPEGVPVRMFGSIRRTYTSDGQGRISDTVPSGTYEFIVTTGCQDRILVTQGGRATLDVADGETIRGDLEVLWLTRYGPGYPVFVDRAGDWPVGVRITLEFSVLDHCSGRRSAGARYDSFAFETSDNVEVVTRPTQQANDEGMSTVTVRCTAPGDIDVDAVDRNDRSTRVDLFQLIGFGDVPRCAR